MCKNDCLPLRDFRCVPVLEVTDLLNMVNALKNFTLTDSDEMLKMPGVKLRKG